MTELFWFFFGVAIGGCFIGAITAHEFKAHFLKVMYALWTQLDLEERFPDLRGQTKSVVAEMLNRERKDGGRTYR